LYELSLKFNNKLSALKKLNPGIKKRIPKGTKVKVITSYKEEENNETNRSKTPVKLTKTFKTKSILSENNNTEKEYNTSKVIETTEEKNNTKDETKLHEVNKTIETKPIQTDKNSSLEKPQVQLPTYKTLTYVVEEGDYIEKIAMKLKVKASELLKPGNVLIFKIKTSPKVSATNISIQSTKTK